MKKIKNFNNFKSVNEIVQQHDPIKDLLSRTNELIGEYLKDSPMIGDNITASTPEEALELLAQIDPTHPLSDEAETLSAEISGFTDEPTFPYPSHGLT